MGKQKFLYTATFASRVRTVTPQDYCSQLAIASLESLGTLFDKSIDLENNPDLLLTAFNAAVVNRANANDDGITTEEAFAISKYFIHKPANIEHNRQHVVGHIISQAFSSFGDNKIVSEESLASTKTPFNISLGAVVYKTVDPDFADMIIESADESSPYYNSISASWEIGFNDYYILLGHKDVEQGELITDPAKVKELSKYLKAYGGPGRTNENESVYRFIVGGVPLGIGYTTTPAAPVKGVIVASTQEDNTQQESETIVLNSEPKAPDLEASLKELSERIEESIEDVTAVANVFNNSNLSVEEVVKRVEDSFSLVKASGLDSLAASETLSSTISVFNSIEKFKNNFSQSTTENVKDNSNMKIESLDQINDELLKNVSAASVIEFIQSELEKSSEIYSKQVKQKEDEISSLASSVEELKAKLSESQKTLEELAKVQAAEKAEREFQERMNALNEQFSLSEKENEVIAKRIRNLSEEDYSAWLADFEVLSSAKKRTAQTPETSTASASQVLDNVEPKPEEAPIPNAGVAPASGFEKFRNAFAGDAIVIK